MKGRLTWEFMPQVRTFRDVSRLRLSLETCFVLSGYGYKNAHLGRFGLADTNRCLCGELVDWRLMLCDCPLYNDVGDLGGWGMVGMDGTIRFGGALEDPRKLLAFSAYARGLFEVSRLRRLFEASRLRGMAEDEVIN